MHGIHDADEDLLIGSGVLADDAQDAPSVRLAGQLDEEAARVQREQVGQQLGVVDLGAVGRVRVAA